MRLLHLVSSGGLYGAESVILHLAGYDNGWTPFVGALNNLHNPHLEVIDKAKHLGIKAVAFDSRGRLDLGTIFRIRKFLLENKIDIIHTHNYKADIVGFFAAMLAGKKWVATNHVWHSTDKKLKFYETIDAFVLKRAAKVVAVSEAIRKDLLACGFRGDHVRTIHNGIKIETYARRSDNVIRDLKSALGIKDDELVVSIIGRLSKEKGHSIFIEAAERILQKNSRIKFLIVGEGPLREDLREQVSRRQLNDKIIFTGIRRDMPEVYSMTDIMVNASFIEGLPMTILEAMAAQAVIIATSVGAVPQVIHDQKNGVLLEAGDLDGLVHALGYLAGHPELRRTLARQAYEDICANFSVATMAAHYKQVYEEVLK